MTPLLLGLGAAYFLSAVGLRALGYNAALPIAFIPFLVFVCLPLAITTVCAAGLLPALLLRPNPTPSARFACVAAGIAMSYWLREPVVWWVLAVWLVIVTRAKWTLASLRQIVLAMTALTLGYACIWNGNYLAAALAGDRLIDGGLLALDMAMLRTTGPGGLGVWPLIPVTTHPTLFRLLEHAYMMLFPQVLVGVILVARQSSARTTAKWLLVLFLAYVLGLLTFLVLPAVGPPIFAPDRFQPELALTLTGEMMRLMAEEFRQVIVGGPLTGFGYFVALPSLHVAVAVLVQVTLRPAPFLFWVWLPVTVLLILSTVVLGYHYLIDLPAGLLLGWALARLLPPPIAGRQVA